MVNFLQGAQCLAGESACHLASTDRAARAGDAKQQHQLGVGHAFRPEPRTVNNQVRLHLNLSHHI